MHIYVKLWPTFSYQRKNIICTHYGVDFFSDLGSHLISAKTTSSLYFCNVRSLGLHFYKTILKCVILVTATRAHIVPSCI
jgi:hypothetical protein